MNPFFTTQERIAALYSAASSWHGTPFFGNSASKGVGVSCQFLAAAIYAEAGLSVASPPEVSMSHAKFSRESLVEPWMGGQTNFSDVPLEEAQAGDLLGFRIGQAIHHVGILLAPGVFIHVVDGSSVQNSFLSDATWRRRLARAWRPVE